MTDEHEDAWKRALLLLEAHHKISNSDLHPYDVPGPGIERLLTDLMHYCHERNIGTTVGSGEYLEFDRMVEFARERFIKERETVIEIQRSDRKSVV